MLAEIFMLRLEAAARTFNEALPTSVSEFVSYTPDSNFTFKEGRKLPAEAAPAPPTTQNIQ
jgi:hypothetical protein